MAPSYKRGFEAQKPTILLLLNNQLSVLTAIVKPDLHSIGSKNQVIYICQWEDIILSKEPGGSKPDLAVQAPDALLRDEPVIAELAAETLHQEFWWG